MCLTITIMDWWNRDRSLVESVVSGPSATAGSAQKEALPATISNRRIRQLRRQPPNRLWTTLHRSIYRSSEASRARYTADALSRKIEGTVGFSFFVMPNGYVRTIRVIHSLDPGLNHSAIEAVSHWHYTPALVDGRPDTVQITADIDFHLP